jgi:hypothetical protein
MPRSWTDRLRTALIGRRPSSVPVVPGLALLMVLAVGAALLFLRWRSR